MLILVTQEHGEDKIVKYEIPQQIIESFCRVRLDVYHWRNVAKFVALVTDVMNGEFRFDRERRSYAELYEEVKEKYQAIGRELEDHSFLLDLPFSSCHQETLRALQEAREKVKQKKM